MTEQIEIGSVLKGKVTGIQPYGAFISLEGDHQGLVHISEITHSFVKDINDHLKIGDEVTVKVLSIDEETGKISLSMKALEEAPIATPQTSKPKKPRKQKQQPSVSQDVGTPKGFNSLKEKLEYWIEQSKRDDLIKK
jgi:general stress protein 13